jgi:hypothetical protein
MSNKVDTIANVSESKEAPVVETTNTENVAEVIAETMVREVTPTQKCLKEDAYVAFKCCVYCWSFSLNGCECACAGLSELCIGLSKLALCFKGALEQIDCDKH